MAASSHADAWRAYLGSDELDAQLRLGDAADVRVVENLLARYSASSPELHHRHFVALRLALRNWLVHLALLPERKQPSPTTATGDRLLLAAHPRDSAPRRDRQPRPIKSRGPEGKLMRPHLPADSLRPWSETLLIQLPAKSWATAAQAWALLFGPSGVLHPPERPAATQARLWHDDYSAACHEARRRQALLFMVFYDPAGAEPEAVATSDVESLASNGQGLRHVFAKLPLDACVSEQGRPLRLLDHASFAELQGRPGIAIIDYESPRAAHYRQIVSFFPRRSGRAYRQDELGVMLNLPPGTLTQRTMIYAVRMHPEAPSSAIGLPHHELLGETESHSTYQAEINVQGHHQWEARFDRINAKLGDLVSREVVAESWPGESLLDAAIECVRCWRSSSGHWEAVSARHAEYAYDMKLGGDGVWYATGIFGD